ncbi:MAG: GNAT family N-acetyltransferase [Candidatus Cloacimonetes bacterium]|nr:GNAT family N-acetyltransferase [Candidatus Cloacimonadota bacterium]
MEIAVFQLPADHAPLLESARLLQRPLRSAHARILYPLLADVRLHEFTGGDPPESEAALTELLRFREQRRSPDGQEIWLNWLIEHKTGGQPLGYSQSTVCQDHAHVAWVIGTEWQGQGFAGEAARALVAWLLEQGVPEVRACVHPAHVASQRVAAFAGLVRTEDMEDGEEVWVIRGSA